MTKKLSRVRVLMMPYQDDDEVTRWGIPAPPPC